MRRLIDDLLDMTRIESGERDRKIEELDMRILADKSMEMFQKDAEKKNVSL